jgi:hypothetical protein
LFAISSLLMRFDGKPFSAPALKMRLQASYRTFSSQSADSVEKVVVADALAR